jgi:hypothetical protein
MYLLTECGAMTLYDLVVFFYQDDIDFQTGTFPNPENK